nr:immunoglobulin heavy chain junction region [Macaca mulatta]
CARERDWYIDLW